MHAAGGVRGVACPIGDPAPFLTGLRVFIISDTEGTNACSEAFCHARYSPASAICASWRGEKTVADHGNHRILDWLAFVMIS